MKLLGVGIMLLGMFGAISARSFENQSPSFGEGSSPYTESTLVLVLLTQFRKSPLKTFDLTLQLHFIPVSQ